MTHFKPRRGHSCPHCKAPAVIYTSRALSPLATEKYLQCTNLACGHQYVVHVGVVRTTVASLIPDADVSIPMVARRATDILVTRESNTHAADAPLQAPPRELAGIAPARSTN